MLPARWCQFCCLCCQLCRLDEKMLCSVLLELTCSLIIVLSVKWMNEFLFWPLQTHTTQADLFSLFCRRFIRAQNDARLGLVLRPVEPLNDVDAGAGDLEKDSDNVYRCRLSVHTHCSKLLQEFPFFLICLFFPLFDAANKLAACCVAGLVFVVVLQQSALAAELYLAESLCRANKKIFQEKLLQRNLCLDRCVVAALSRALLAAALYFTRKLIVSSFASFARWLTGD